MLIAFWNSSLLSTLWTFDDGSLRDLWMDNETRTYRIMAVVRVFRIPLYASRSVAGLQIERQESSSVGSSDGIAASCWPICYISYRQLHHEDETFLAI
jgi:hypothetical protein